MNFAYTRLNLTRWEWRIQRMLETLPALSSWGTLVLIFSLCLFFPIAGVVTIILFDLFWLFRLIYLTLFLVISYALLEIEGPAPWNERLADLTQIESALPRRETEIKKLPKPSKAFFSALRHLTTLRHLKKSGLSFPRPSEIFHLVIIPFCGEEFTVLNATVRALAHVDYLRDKMVVVLGVEARGGEEALKTAERLKKNYGGGFLHFEICLHPKDLPGEAAVKGANATYAAQRAKKFFEDCGVPFEHILVSCFDCDTVVSPQYFACLTYNYLIHPKRTRTSFQPIPVYHNNLLEAPHFARVLETGSSFFQLVEATDPETLVTFSSHSMSFQALVEIGYWPPDLISDDSAIFWKAFLAYDGNYGVHPLYTTLSMDVALGRNFWETCQIIYRQKRRWAWGVENFPIFVRGLLSNPRIPWGLKIRQAFRLFELNHSWATWPPTMMILSWMPGFVVSREFAGSVAHFNAPRIAGVIFNLATAALGISILLSLLLLPRKAKAISIYQKAVFALQWLLIPVITIVFGAIPALDAQTRLALGHYMEFFVSPKGNVGATPAYRRQAPGAPTS